MLKHSFSHIVGISEKLETTLWDYCVFSWDHLAEACDLPIPKAKLALLSQAITESQSALEKGDHKYFSKGLSNKQNWRIFPHYKNNVAYLDIETTGLRGKYDEITTIAIYTGKDIKCYVNGQNLNDFVKDIKKYDLLVTYNGKCFDLPFIESFFDIKLHQSHIDLRYVLHSLGIKGGLKGCEKYFGISRKELDGMDGYFAISLWKDYCRSKNPSTLETLLAYNVEDVVNLEYLMHQAYNLKLRDIPFAIPKLEIPPKPEVPYKPDMQIVKRLLSFMDLRKLTYYR
ncbi:MAG: ribonuclease H-like domain-containing protein [Candidatus Riflemargulisbacteria bacterium]